LVASARNARESRHASMPLLTRLFHAFVMGANRYHSLSTHLTPRAGVGNDRNRRILDIGRQGGDGPLATLLSYSDRDSGGQVWVNRVGSRPLRKRLVKANGQSVSILIFSSDGATAGTAERGDCVLMTGGRPR